MPIRDPEDVLSSVTRDSCSSPLLVDRMCRSRKATHHLDVLYYSFLTGKGRGNPSFGWRYDHDQEFACPQDEVYGPKGSKRSMSSSGLLLARCVWATLSQATQALARTTGPPLPSREDDKRVKGLSLARFDLARLLLLDASLLCASVGDNFSREFSARLTFYSSSPRPSRVSRQVSFQVETCLLHRRCLQILTFPLDE